MGPVLSDADLVAPKVINPDAVYVTHYVTTAPDGTQTLTPVPSALSDEDLMAPTAKEAPTTLGGTAKAAGSSLIGGFESFDPSTALASGADMGIDVGASLIKKLGASPLFTDTAAANLQDLRKGAGFTTGMERQQAAGVYHAPQNRTERYASAIASMIPNAALGPEGLPLKVASVVLPGVGSEAAREGAQAAGMGPVGQGVASAVGAAAGGGLTRLRVGDLPKVGLPEARALTQEGVSLTPGQRLGGIALSAEDKAQSLPILGDAIRGARTRGRLSLNRAVANRALAPIGEVLPADVKPGVDAVAHVEQRLGDAYDRAKAMISSVTPDDDFNTALDGIRASLKSEAPTVLARFNALVGDHVLARFSSGPLDGAAIQDMKSQLGELAADNIGGGGADRTLGRKLNDVAAQITALAGRASPDYVAAQGAADKGWANFVRMRNAASRTGTDSGVFTPGQLKLAVRTEDASVGKGGAARGSATLADLANNAASVMNQTIPNSGTTDRLLLAGLGAAAAGPGHFGVPVVAGLSAASVPYLLMGRRIAAEAVRDGASPEFVRSAAAKLEALAAEDPNVIPLLGRVRRRLGDVAPIAASAAALSLSGGGQDQQEGR